MSKSVEEYLNEVDYSFKDYLPSKEALGFVAFIKMVEGGETSNKTPVVHLNLLDKVFSKIKKLAVLCFRGYAKALSLDTCVLTDRGKVSVKDINIGDSILSEDGSFTKVVGKSEIFNKPMYRITLKDGRSIKVSEDHINTVIHKRVVRYGKKNVTEYQRRNLTTKELLNCQLFSRRKITKKNPTGKELHFWIPNNKPAAYTHKDLPFDPYTLGVLLGDGSIDRKTGYARLHCHKDDFITYKKLIPYKLGKEYRKKINQVVVGVLGSGTVMKHLGVNVHGDHKFIPENYFYGSIEQRTNLLKGLMDTDGTITKAGNSSFCSNSRELCEGVATLVRSLGGIATVTKYDPSGIGKKDIYKTKIKINTGIFNLERKKIREHTKSTNKVGIVNIERIANEKSQCIAVDNSSKTFVVNDYIVTHNSTLLTVYLPFYIAVYGKLNNFGTVNYILMVLDSQDGGAKTVRKALEMTWNNSKFLRKYLPEAKFTDIFVEFTNIEGHSIGIKLTGAQQSIRGTRYTNENGSHRPEIAILDDILSDTDAKSPTVIANVENTLYKAVDKALDPNRRKTIYIGTVFSSSDPLYKAIESGRWQVAAYPVCETFPCSKEEFRGAWEDRFPYEVVLDMYEDALAMGRMMDFNGEMMNRVISDEDRLVAHDDIVWFSRKNILKYRNKYNFYITTDFTTSPEASADFSVISVWAYTHNGEWLLVDGICKKQRLDESIDDLFRLVAIYKPLEVGIETSGQQGGFINWINQQKLERNVFFNLAKEEGSSKEGIRPTAKKIVRFLTAVPLFKSKKIWLAEEMKNTPHNLELLEELSFASLTGFKSKHDDVCDTISMLTVLRPFKPSEETTYIEVDEYKGKFKIFEDDEKDIDINSTIF